MVSTEAAQFLVAISPAEERARLAVRVKSPRQVRNRDNRSNEEEVTSGHVGRMAVPVFGGYHYGSMNAEAPPEPSPLARQSGLAAAVSEHGVLRLYLHKIHRASGSACLYSWHPVNDAKHTIFDCPHWSPHRGQLEKTFGRRIRPEDVQEVLCGPGDTAAHPSADQSSSMEHRCQIFIENRRDYPQREGVGLEEAPAILGDGRRPRRIVE